MTQVAQVEQQTRVSSDRSSARRIPKIAHWFPHRALGRNNPFRQSELRRVMPISALRNTTRVWILYIVLGMCAVWVWQAIPVIDDQQSRTWNDLPDSWYTLGENIGFVLGIIALADRFLYDFIVVLLGLNSINKELTRGRWELISITGMNTEHLINAKHQVNQIRAWRATSIIMGLRVGIVVVMLLHFLLGVVIAQDDVIYFERSLIEYPLNLLTLFLIVLTIMIVFGVFIVEVRWRLRTLSAASVFTSSRRHANTVGIFYSIGMLLAFWMVQVFALVIGVAFTASVLNVLDRQMYSIYYDSDDVAFWVTFALFIGTVLTATVTYLIYHEMTALWLNKATHRLIDRGGGSVPRRYFPQRAYKVVFGGIIGFWAIYALATIYEANNRPLWINPNDLPLGHTYALIIIVIAFGLSLAVRVSLDFSTLLATKRLNPRARYMYNDSRVARELNILLGVRLAVLCAGVLYIMLDMRLRDTLTAENGLLAIGLFLVLLILQLGEVRWSQVSLTRFGIAIDRQYRRKLTQISLIYLVMAMRWAIYTLLLGIVIIGVRYSPLFTTFTTQSDVASGAMLYVTTISLIFGAIIFAVHRVIQYLLR